MCTIPALTYCDNRQLFPWNVQEQRKIPTMGTILTLSSQVGISAQFRKSLFEFEQVNAGIAHIPTSRRTIIHTNTVIEKY